MTSFRVLLTILLFTSLSFAQKIELQWKGMQKVDYGSVIKTIPSFENEGFSVNNGYPFYFQTKKHKEGHSYAVKNLVWRQVSSQELQDIDISLLPESEIAEVNTQYNPEQKTFLSNVMVSAFKKEGQKIFKLQSFDLVETAAPSINRSIAITAETPLKAGTFYKIKTDKTGIFKITAKFLRDNGINPAGINPANFRVYGNGGHMLPEHNQDFRYDGLQENAIEFIGGEDGKWDEGDYAVFYSKGPHGYNLYNTLNGSGNKRTETRIDQREHHLNIYEDFAYYFINFDKGPGKRVADDAAPASGNLITKYDAYQFVNEEKVNINKIGRLWVGDSFINSYQIALNTRLPLSATEVRFRTTIYGYSAAGTTLEADINGTKFTNRYSGIFQPATFSGSLNNVSGNAVTFTFNPNISGNPTASYYFDYAEIQYKEALQYTDGQLQFRDFSIHEGSNTNYQFAISNSTGIDRLWEVADATNAKNKRNLSADKSQFLFGYTASYQHFNNEFVAFKLSSAYDPAFVGKIDQQDLKSLKNIDYLIITTRDFILQGRRIADYYKKEKNYTTAVIDHEKIYNEYSSGSKDATAIRDFITQLNQPNGSLKYVLILGDTSFDFRNKTTTNKNHIPSYESEFSLDFVNSFVTDDYFVMTAPQTSSYIQSIFPDLPVGRILAETINEAKYMTDKTLAYYNALPGQSSPFGDWRMKLNFVADDDQDSRNDRDPNPYMHGTFHDVMNRALVATFENNSDKPEYNIKKSYLDAFPAQNTAGGQRFPQINQSITNSMSNSLFIYYFGHGGINGWAQERVLTLNEIRGFNNFNSVYSRFPLVSTITCEFTLWDDHLTNSAGEQLFKLYKGGVNNMITSSRAISVDYGRRFTEIFIKNIMELESDDLRSVGHSFLEAKKEYGINANHLKVNLLGDPALKLARPKRLMTIDNIASPVQGKLRALDFVTITGKILKTDGTADETFTGRVTVNIFDKRLNKRTLNNDGDLTPILQYTEEGSAIVKASGKATDGIYKIEFYMPKDINFDEGDGRILVYGDNGSYDVFTNQNYRIGGINDKGISDSEPPKVKLFMNNIDFANGGITNPNPMLLACITDETGINSTGAGIGHDITIYLDGEVINTTVLNDFYISGEGNGCTNASLLDYQKGFLSYPLQNLEPGEHVLTFKIWDINNNSTTETITFTVRDPAEENLVVKRLLNWPNPFTSKTYIQFEHNCNDVLDVNVQIYTITGKIVKSFSAVVSSAPYMEGFRTNRVEIEWDGTDNYGDSVAKGTYIYKVFAKSRNQEMCNGSATQIEKMILLK